MKKKNSMFYSRILDFTFCLKNFIILILVCVTLKFFQMDALHDMNGNIDKGKISSADMQETDSPPSKFLPNA